jgi:3-oxoacyl-[acyl-carrier-protein] synthase II
MTRQVVVTGTGAVTSLGVGARALVDGWIEGRTGIEDGLSACTDFDPSDVLGRKEARRSDRFAHLGLAAAAEALEEAGWEDGGPHDPARTGCVFGTGVGGIATFETQTRVLINQGERALSPLTVPMMMPNAAAALVAMRYGWTGPTLSVGSACATGAHAIGMAMRMIQSGELDAAVAGASEASLTPTTLAGFRAMDALSRSGTSLPFDARRDGFVIGEGSGALVLEAEDAARERGARVLGHVLGFGQTSDAHHITAPDPSGRGAERAIRQAMEEAEVDPDEVDYVNAHGTATEHNDRVETLAIKQALGEAAQTVPVSSTKSVVGHLLASAGAVEAIATIHAMRRGIAAPTVGYAEQEPGLDLDYVPESRPLRPMNGHGRRVALSNSFGFGGHNVVLCLSCPEEVAA